MATAQQALVQQAYVRVTEESTHPAGTWSRPDGGTLDLAIGRLMPDPLPEVPHSLDPKKYDITSFIALTVPQCEELFETGKITLNSRELSLPAELSDTETPENNFARKLFLTELKRIEADKKLSILEHLLHGVKLQDILDPSELEFKKSTNSQKIGAFNDGYYQLENEVTEEVNGQKITKTIIDYRADPISEERKAFQNAGNNLRDAIDLEMKKLRTTYAKKIAAQEAGQTGEAEKLGAEEKTIFATLDDLFQETDSLWKDLIEGFDFNPKNSNVGLRSSNYEAVRRYTNEGHNYLTGQGIPGLHLNFNLFFPQNGEPLSKRELRTLFKNKEFLRLYKLADTFHLYRDVQINGTKAAASIEELVKRLKLESKEISPKSNSEEKVDIERKQRYAAELRAGRADKSLLKQFLSKPKKTLADLTDEQIKAMSTQELRKWQEVNDAPMLDPEILEIQLELSSQVDAFSAHIASDGRFDKKYLLESPEVVGADMHDLLDIAFGKKINLAKNRKERRAQKIACYEARKKLTLMILFHEVNKLYKKTIDAGIKPITEIEAKFLIKNNEKTFLNIDGKPHEIELKTREGGTKTLLSMQRKVEEKNKLNQEVAKDIFAESIVFKEAALDLLKQGSFDFAPRTFFSGEEKTEKETLHVTMPIVLGKLIQQWLTEANKDGKQRLVVHEYKDERGGKRSGGAGGGDDLHFIKLYLWHTDDSGVIRKKEMHFYFPREVDGQVKSGEYDYAKKMADQSDYTNRRVFATKEKFDLVRRLRPPQVYGHRHTRKIYAGKVR